MELHQLRYFVAVAEVGSFGGAARRCNVAQPSISQQIMKLEEELGHKLFDRLGRSVELTEAGGALLPRARRVLVEIREATDHLTDELDAGRGTLAVGAIPTIAPFLLPGAIQRFSQACPQATLSVREEMTPALIDALIAAEIDLALVSRPIEHASIRREVLFDEKLLIVVGRDSPFAGMGQIELQELDGQDTVVLDEMHCLAQQFQDVCRIMRVEHRVACRATQLATVQKLVELNLGVGLVPEMAAAADGSPNRIYLELSGASPRREIAVATRTGRSRPVLAQRFLDCLRPETGD